MVPGGTMQAPKGRRQTFVSCIPSLSYPLRGYPTVLTCPASWELHISVFLVSPASCTDLSEPPCRDYDPNNQCPASDFLEPGYKLARSPSLLHLSYFQKCTTQRDDDAKFCCQFKRQRACPSSVTAVVITVHLGG